MDKVQDIMWLWSHGDVACRGMLVVLGLMAWAVLLWTRAEWAGVKALMVALVRGVK